MKFLTKFANFSEVAASIQDQIIQMDREHFPTPWTAEQWRHFFDLTDGNYLLVCGYCEKKVVGYSLFQLIDCELLAHLLKIVVKPECRRAGHGRELLRESIEQLKIGNISSIFLEVEQGNSGAKSLYKTLGFLELDVLKNFYGTGRHGLSMRRN